MFDGEGGVFDTGWLGLRGSLALSTQGNGPDSKNNETSYGDRINLKRQFRYLTH